MKLIPIEDTEKAMRYVNIDAITSIGWLNDNRWIVTLMSGEDFFIDDQTLARIRLFCK